MILPARRSLQLLGINAAVALLASIFPELISLWYASVALSLLLAFADLVLVVTATPPRAERFAPPTLPLGVKRTLRLRLHNDGTRPLLLQVFDHYPASLHVEGFPLRLSIAAGQFAESVYAVTPTERGKLHFPCLQVRVLSPLQLWWHDLKLPVTAELKVYPNFAAVAQYALLATDHHLSHLGIMQKRRRGEGQDFHQLREYRAGDSLRQIDWKATARMRKAISREYQDERDQEIIFLLDCGHRMLAKDAELSHFDHTLNAILLLTYVALRQGDAVGLGSFGGESRWLPAHKGQQHLQHMLSTLYDIQPTPYAPDYAQAATELLVRQKKRALVILLTNLRDEDLDDLLPALHLLRKRHVVLLASMREQALDQALQTPVDSLETAIHHAALEHYLNTRNNTLERIKASGIRCLDVPPRELSVNLINHYMDIKRSGIL